MNIPVSCGKCRYGNTFDISIDDLCTYCRILGTSEDWCDFPNRPDGTLRMHNCPISNLTKEQMLIGEKRIVEDKKKAQLLYRYYHGRTVKIRKRSLGRLKKIQAHETRYG